MIEHAAKMTELGDFGGTMTWNGEDYPVSIGAWTQDSVLQAGGFQKGAETMVVYRKSLFGALRPGPGQRFTLTDRQGQERDLRVRPSAGVNDLVYLIQLTCDDANK